MTVNNLIEKLNLKILAQGDTDREITGGYCGDLLSWVMGRATEGCVWITIMTNINIAAVGQLADVAAIIVAEGAVPDENVLATAEDKGVNILLSDKTAFRTAVEIADDI